MKYVVIFVLLAGCTTTLTPGGQQVILVTANQKEKFCDFVDVITASNSMGSGAAGDRQNAMNEARNVAAARGGNAIRLLSTDSETSVYGNQYGVYSSSEAVLQAEVLKCDLAAMKSSRVSNQ